MTINSIKRFLSRIDAVLGSKTRLRFIGNCVLMVSASFFLVVILLFQQQETAVNWVGSLITSAHKKSYVSEKDQALEWLREGQMDSVIGLLTDRNWQSIQLGDRVYPFKREVIKRLCEELLAVKRYEELHNWSSIWRDLDDRDVTALAYWHESTRHIPDRAEDGRQGLKREWERFPLNFKLTEFHALALHESGDTDAARIVIGETHKKSTTAMREGWHIHFGKHANDLLPAYSAQLFGQIRRMEWSAARQTWSVIREEVFDSEVRRSRRRGRKIVKVSIAPSPEGWVSIPLHVPANITRLRIDPPGSLKLAISGIRLTMGNEMHEFSVNDLRYKGIRKRNGRLEIVDNQSQISLPLPAAGWVSGAEVIDAELRFNAQVRDLGVGIIDSVKSR